MRKAKTLISPVTPFQQNSTLLWCGATKRAVVIDPGGDLPIVERAIAQAWRLGRQYLADPRPSRWWGRRLEGKA